MNIKQFLKQEEKICLQEIKKNNRISPYLFYLNGHRHVLSIIFKLNNKGIYNYCLKKKKQIEKEIDSNVELLKVHSSLYEWMRGQEIAYTKILAFIKNSTKTLNCLQKERTIGKIRI